jgi:acyl-CoA synthetase (NDP forming)
MSRRSRCRDEEDTALTPERRSKDIASLLHPKSVAIVGCVPTATGRLGGLPHHYLLRQDAPVEIYAVNPRHEEVDGLPCYPALAALPTTPDVVLVLVGGSSSLEILRQAEALGAPTAIVFGSGFGSHTEVGRALERELATFTTTSSIAVCGPNTDGVFNVIDGIPLGFAPLAGFRPRPVGDVALVTQSGAMGSSLVAQLIRAGLGVTYACAVGNAVDRRPEHFIEFLVDDERTRTVLVYAEGISDRVAFAAVADRAADAGKLIAVMKAGTSDVGRAAARSHTGSLAGSHEIFRALAKRHHVVVADSLEELVAVAAVDRVARRLPLSGEPGIGVLSASGAIAAHLADKVVQHGLGIPKLSPATQRCLEGRLEGGRPDNPFDLTAQVTQDASLHPDVLDALAADPGVDLILESSVVGETEFIERMERELVAVTVTAAVPAVVYSSDGSDAADHPVLSEGGVPVSSSADLLLGSVVKVMHWQRALAQPRAAPTTIDEDRRRRARRLLADQPRTELPAAVAWELLGLYGVPFAEEHIVASADEARTKAQELGYPVVAKVNAIDAPHRTDLGLVVLDLADSNTVAAAFDQLAARAADLGLDDAEVVLQPMIAGGTEIIVAARSDPESGPFVMVGAGGVLAEVLADRQVAAAPLGLDDARELVDGLRIAGVLRGARGAPALHIEGLADVVVRLGAMAVELEAMLDELEINPLIVRRDGVVAVDVLAAATRRLRRLESQ